MSKASQPSETAPFIRASATVVNHRPKALNAEVFTEKQFPRETLPPNFVFSGPEMIRLVAHRRRVAEARKLGPVVRSAPGLAA